MSVRKFVVLAAGFCAGGVVFAAQPEWLALCNRCLNPTVISKTGAGTSNAVATAKITQREAADWCANESPGDKQCVRDQMASDEAKKTWRASADCTTGKLIAADSHSYVQAGVWTEDIGKGRTRWRNGAGQIVKQDNASGGLALSQQWELLCPGQRGGVSAGSAKAANAANVKAARPAASSQNTTPSPNAAAQYAVGERVEARYGSQWIKARVQQIRQANGSGGPELAYDVLLDNGKRGVLPSRMLRKLAG